MVSPLEKLDRAFFARPTPIVAVELLACTLWRMSPDGVTSGRIVETEAYLDAKDLASHAAWSKRGQDVMHQAPGTVYIYRSYGMHWMFNIVAHEPGAVGAVLIRAVEPMSGIPLMQARRAQVNALQLCSGPGKLCQAFGIDESLHKSDLAESEAVWILRGDPPDEVKVGERIGITKSAELPLRFFEANSRYVSAHRRGVPFPARMLPSS